MAPGVARPTRKATARPVRPHQQPEIGDHGETIVPLLPLQSKPMVVAAVADGSKDVAAQAVTPPFDGLPWGLWQARTTLLAGLCKVTTAWHMAIVLYASTPSPFGEFRCTRRPGDSTGSHASDGNASGASGASGPRDSFWDMTWEPWLPCDEGELIEYGVAAAQPLEGECHGWLELRTINEWSAGCYRQFLGSSSQLCYLVGILAGGALCTALLRRYSPRSVLLVSLTCEAAFALLLAFVQVFWAHGLVRFFLAVFSVHLFTSAATISTDVCVGMSKIITSSMFECWWALGIISIAIFGPFTLNWTCLQATLSLPSMALVLPCLLLLPESPRWLVSRGLVERAAVEWSRAATVNGQTHLLPPEPQLVQCLSQHAAAERALRKSERSVWTCSTTTKDASGWCYHLAKLVAVHILFGCVTNTFFGSILNVRNWGTPGMLGLAVGAMSAGCCGLLGFAIGMMVSTRTSRPLFWMGALQLLGGSVGLLAHMVGPDGSGALPRAFKVTLFALSERMAVAASVPILNNAAPTLVPATQRFSLVFSCVLFGRVCLLAAPFVGNLVVFGEAFPLTVFGVQLMVAGACSLALQLLVLFETRLRSKQSISTCKY